jgi:dipeptidyl aminopeptidase/acylaminoacyl peptidase
MTRDRRPLRGGPAPRTPAPPATTGTPPSRPPRGSRDPYGLLPTGAPIAPIASIVGLLIVAFVTVSIFDGRLPWQVTSSGGGNGGGGVTRTPAPSNVVIVPTLPPQVVIPGSFVYAKQGAIWLQKDGAATQLTHPDPNIGYDSMPSFSPDGQWIYFIRTKNERGRWPFANTGDRPYDLTTPSLERIKVAGGNAELLLNGTVNPPGNLKWFFWIREPVLGPDGRTVALLSDGPDPTASDVVVQFFDLKTKALSKPRLTEMSPLGHQDPAWRPDGKVLLFVRNSRDGSRGTPEIWSYSTTQRTARKLTNPGYLHPSYSRDQRWIAATKTTAFGTDIVILSAGTGAEVFRVTNDGRAWAPVFSPKGDAVAFLHSDGQIVDLETVQLGGAAPNWTASQPIALTELSGLDSGSRPDWFIPPDRLPAPSAPAASSSPSG